MNALRSFLFREVSNTTLVVFRIFFGLLMTIESWGAIATGWVKRTFVDPAYTFTFHGFEWTQFLLGDFMYFYYFLMGIFGIGIMLGYRYTIAATGFFLMWSLSYFMQKTNYNNHYYLIMLISGLMVFMPAAKYKSLDAKRNPSISATTMPQWVVLMFKAQIACVYFYAAIAKLYPGWLNNDFLSLRLGRSAQWFQSKLGPNPITQLLHQEPFQYFLTYSGLIFDFFIIPFLYFRKTRTIAFIALLIFHLTNSALLHIGIFPFFAISLTVFYFSPKTINSIFKIKKEEVEEIQQGPEKENRPYWLLNTTAVAVVLFILIQIALPLRHWAIPGDVLWTEEGHRLSWRMMLRTKRIAQAVRVTVVVPSQNRTEIINLNDYLNNDQIQNLSTKPDLMWSFAQYLEKEYKKQGIPDIEVYMQSRVAVNKGKFYELVDETKDITAYPWNTFGHQEWIYEEPKEIEKPNLKNSPNLRQKPRIPIRANKDSMR